MLKNLVTRFLISSFVFLACLLGSVDQHNIVGGFGINTSKAQVIQQMLIAEAGANNTSIITSIQPITITIATSATSGTATITSVNTSLTAIFYNGITSNNTATNAQSNNLVGLQLTNATTVTATRGASSASFTVTVNATVVTFASSVITSIQTGVIAFTGAQTTNTATITSVTTTNSAVLFNGSTISAGVGAAGYYYTGVTLTNATTVTANRGETNGSATMNIYFTVINFAGGFLNSSTQTGTFAVTTSGTATISAVTTSQAMVLWGGNTSTDTSSSSGLEDMANLTLTNGTTVTGAVNGSNSGTTTAYYTIIEFKASQINSLNRGTITVATSTTSNTATITSVNTAKSLANFTGFSACTGQVNENGASCYSKLALTNATTVTASVNTSAARTVNQGWEIIEFK